MLYLGCISDVALSIIFKKQSLNFGEELSEIMYFSDIWLFIIIIIIIIIIQEFIHLGKDAYLVIVLPFNC